MNAGLSRCGEVVRRHDPDRFLCTLFAPPARRETLWTLYAVNHELARALEVASQPTLALIRLQWWREVVEGARRRHEVAGPLGAAIDAGELLPSDLEGMIAGRELAADPIETLEDWRAYLLASAGGVQATAARVLGADEGAMAQVRRWGAVYGGAGALRNAAAGRRGPLPASRGGADLAAFIRSMDGAGDGPRRVPRSVVAAALPVVLARRDLRRPLAPGRPRSLGDRLAVLIAAARGRV